MRVQIMNTIFNYLRTFSSIKWISIISFCFALLLFATPSSAFAQNSPVEDSTDEVSSPSLSILHSAMQDYVLPGETVEFMVAITNTGDFRLESVNISNPSVPDCDRTFGALEPDQAFTYTCELTDVFATVSSEITVIGTAPRIPLLVVSAEVQVDVLSAVLAIIKDPIQGQARRGERIVMSYSYTNSGSGAAVGVQIAETVPEGTYFVPEASAEGWVCANDAVEAGTTCIYSIDRIEAGESATDQFPFVVVKIVDDTDTEETTVSGSGSPVEGPIMRPFFLPLMHNG